MKTFLKGALMASIAVFATSAFAAPGWSDDYDKALEQAKKENKRVLLDFTGSDWCGWCIKLGKDVFSQTQFQDYAKEKLVLVEVDFPQAKELSDKVKKQNEQLKEKYSIEGFPTLVVLDAEGTKLGEIVGYVEGGPEAFIKKLDEVSAKK